MNHHNSQPLTDHLLDHADLLLTMTPGHRDSILGHRPDLEDRVRTLSPEGKGVSDPIGGPLEEYERCQQEIESYLTTILEQIPVNR